MEKIVDKYTYRIEWSEEDQIFIARCMEFSGLAAHGTSSESTLKEIKKVINESIKWLKEEGKAVPEPLEMKKFKGNLTLRMPPRYIVYWRSNRPKRVSPSTSTFYPDSPSNSFKLLPARSSHCW